MQNSNHKRFIAITYILYFYISIFLSTAQGRRADNKKINGTGEEPTQAYQSEKSYKAQSECQADNHDQKTLLQKDCRHQAESIHCTNGI
jgi:hypothetical protein